MDINIYASTIFNALFYVNIDEYENEQNKLYFYHIVRNSNIITKNTIQDDMINNPGNFNYDTTSSTEGYNDI